MSGLEDHERPLLLVLREGAPAAEAFEALLAHPDVRAWHLPPPWALERSGLDLLAARPYLGAITRESLRDALTALLALATPAALAGLAARTWHEAPEPVRAFYLRRPALGTLAATLRLAPKTRDLPPPAPFLQAQVFLTRFELEYRLAPEAGREGHLVAPSEEASLVLYPFDVANAEARREAGLPEGKAPVLEAFAYGPGRARHRRVLEEIAASRGWRVVDTLAR